MDIEELRKLYGQHHGVRALAAALADESRQHIVVSGLSASSAPLAFAAAGGAAAPMLFVLNDAEEAGYFYHDLVQLSGEERVLFFPSSLRRSGKSGQRDAANAILRTEVAAALTGNQPHSRPLPSREGGQPLAEKLPTRSLLPSLTGGVGGGSAGGGTGWGNGLLIVTYPDALAEGVAPKSVMEGRTLQVRVGQQIEIGSVVQTLMELGFERTDYVYEPGQVAVRGSLVDVFSFSSEYPFRIDFFGDEVDSIRTFEVETQLSRSRLEAVTLVPDLGREAQNPSSGSLLTPSLQGRAGVGLAEVELVPLSALLPRETIVVARGELECEQDFEGFRRVEMSASLGNGVGGVGSAIAFAVTPQPLFHKNFDLLSSTFKDYIAKGYTLYILADSAKQTDRLKEILKDLAFTPVAKTLHAGFADDELKVCVFTDHQIFDRFHKYSLRSDRARSGKAALSLKELQEFEVGDYVVHVDHGIGRFGGLVRVPKADGGFQEMIKIVYEHEDLVYVSIHALHKVSKYKGKEGDPPRISHLGTGAWERMKERTKAKIKDIARDLIKLYARRREQQGFRFSPDTYMQHELEASFLYEDTPDQLKATADVKADMERGRPMDRLVCGDVGFGKTEVAVRAALKAAVDGKQVAVMVPTTVLAYQHFHTFSDRLKDFPVRVDYLTRARTPKQTKEILADLADGKIDIIVGTHKLIGKAVAFKDLGLLIIDEEQKFGVATKEKLRQMKTNVDTLTLTATPIPRTLQFSLMGARDLSVIRTPPPNRYPIQTEVHTFSADVIAEAVTFEMSRGGQTFIVTNRIAALPELEILVHKYVPDARVAIGHGRMAPDELEQTVMAFAAYDYDVLISTTIIENGLDIPNANTIIICAAHTFGLSDLHQMRGRVGRSNKKAFCYLLAPPLSALPQDARRRLQAIENFSALGSGLHIAMQDLDIRGAGNLLGCEQSGFIADLGYETYQKVLSEAVRELKNEEFKDLYSAQIEAGEVTSGEDFVEDCTLESDLQMSFPDAYVPGSSERMLLYRELDGLQTEEAIEAFRQRLRDRFGAIPEEGEELIRVVRLRRLGKYFGGERIILKQGRMRMYFVKDDDSPFFHSQAFGQIISYFTTHPADCQLDEVKGRRSMLIRGIGSVKAACELLEEIRK